MASHTTDQLGGGTVPLSDTETTTATAAASLLTEMQSVLAHVPEAISLYRNELEKLLTACVKSQESEQRLVHRTAEILTEIQSSHEAMLRDQEEEHDALVQKKKTRHELEAVRQQITASQQLETDKQHKLRELRSTLGALQTELATLAMPGTNATSADVTLNEEQERLIASMKKQRAELARDVEAKGSTLQDLRLETSNLYALMLDEEAKNANFEDQQAVTTAAIHDKQSQTEKQTRRKMVLEKDLKLHQQTLEQLVVDVTTKDKQRERNEECLRAKELLLRESKQKMEKYLKQYDGLFRTTHQLTDEMQTQWHKNVELQKLNGLVEQELHAKDAQRQQAVNDATRLEKLMDLTREQLVDMDAKRLACDNDKERIKLELNQLLNGAIESETKQGELVQKQLDDLLREREVLNKMLVKATDRAQMTFDLQKIKENTLKNLQNEINGLKAQVKKQRRQIQQLVSERETYEREAARATQKFMTSLEEAKLQDLQVVSLQQKIGESEGRLKQQQNLYEAVRTDRNVYSKQLLESQDAIGEMKRKFKIMNHQIEQLKEEITAKDHALVKEHFDHHKVDKEKEILKNEVLRIKKQIQSSEQILGNQHVETTKLATIIQEADDEQQRQRKELASVVHDRDTLRQQLLARTDELRVLYEKIKIQKSTLAKGHRQFQDKQTESSQLQQRVHALVMERDASGDQLQHEDALKRERRALENALLAEKTKIRALSEELDHPLNVHRWRTLEGSDPTRFARIRKLQMLQRQLIQKYEETTVKDLLILEKEKLYVELKTILARQPGAEVAEQLVVYKATLKGKQQQMKHMDDELALYKMQVAEYRRDHERLEKEKQQLVQHWLEQQLVQMNMNARPVEP